MLWLVLLELAHLIFLMQLRRHGATRHANFVADGQQSVEGGEPSGYEKQEPAGPLKGFKY